MALKWDRIEIKGLEVYAHHGVYEEERTLGQRFVVDVALCLSTAEAGASDALEETVNYGSVARKITAILQQENYLLIERAAEEVANALLGFAEQIREVTVRIEKPWAPIGLPLKTVAVEITRGWHTACLSLGSNMGDKEGYLDHAVERLGAHPRIRLLQVSDWLETAPYGYLEQDDFLNGCVLLETTLSPEALLHACQEIENEAGRVRTIRWGPRTLDIDLLFYDEEIIGTKELIVPHPEIEKRLFVLRPLAAIAPWLRHPVSKKTIRELLAELDGQQEVRYRR